MQNRGRREKGTHRRGGVDQVGIGDRAESLSSLPLSPFFPSPSPYGGRSGHSRGGNRGHGKVTHMAVTQTTESRGAPAPDFRCSAALFCLPLSFLSLSLSLSADAMGIREPLAGFVGVQQLIFTPARVPLFPAPFRSRDVRLSEGDVQATPYARRLRRPRRPI